MIKCDELLSRAGIHYADIIDVNNRMAEEYADIHGLTLDDVTDNDIDYDMCDDVFLDRLRDHANRPDAYSMLGFLISYGCKSATLETAGELCKIIQEG